MWAIVWSKLMSQMGCFQQYKVLTSEVMWWDLTEVNLLWPGEVECYLFYKGNTGQGHRRRLLPPRLWCIINRKTDPRSSTVHCSLAFPFPPFPFELHFLTLTSHFWSRLKSSFVVFTCIQEARILTTHLQGHETASHADFIFEGTHNSRGWPHLLAAEHTSC